MLLRSEVEKVKPNLIILFGRVAVEAISGRKDSIREMIGDVHERDGWQFICRYHPAAVVYPHKPGMPDFAEEIRKTLKMAKRVVRNGKE